MRSNKLCSGVAFLGVVFLGMLMGGVLSAAVSIHLPPDSPVVLISSDYGDSSETARGGRSRGRAQDRSRRHYCVGCEHDCLLFCLG